MWIGFDLFQEIRIIYNPKQTQYVPFSIQPEE